MIIGIITLCLIGRQWLTKRAKKFSVQNVSRTSNMTIWLHCVWGWAWRSATIYAPALMVVLALFAYGANPYGNDAINISLGTALGESFIAWIFGIVLCLDAPIWPSRQPVGLTDPTRVEAPASLDHGSGPPSNQGVHAGGKSAAIVLLCFTCGYLGWQFSHASHDQIPHPDNFPVAIFRHKAEAGDAEAALKLGELYLEGKAVPRDQAQGMVWLAKAANLGSAEAQEKIASIYLGEAGYSRAIPWLRKAAKQGNPTAENQLGSCYSLGQGVPKDDVEAVKWYQMAAAQNELLAELNLGDHYASGQGVVRDESEALRWYRKAADQDFPLAQSKLGLCYYFGQGVARDYVEAAACFQKAADRGDVYGQCYLGICFEQGAGVQKDELEAVKWLRKAADQGNPQAETNLGVSYSLGLGIPQDEAEGMKWFQKAAAQNFSHAQYLMGLYLFTGEGVVKDNVEAYKWENLASAKGDENAKKLLSQLEAVMTPEQIAEGQRLSHEFAEKASVPTLGQ